MLRSLHYKIKLADSLRQDESSCSYPNITNWESLLS